MATLETAIEIAAEAHAGQTDKYGSPYIAHPMRMMARFLGQGDERRAIVATLHDVIEDSAFTLEDLAMQGFARDIILAVDALTRRPEEGYRAFVARAAANDLAKPVKVADLIDNMSAARLSKLPEPDRSRLRRKYAGALEILGVPAPTAPGER